MEHFVSFKPLCPWFYLSTIDDIVSSFILKYNLPDVRVGDDLLVDGGMVRFEVIEKIGPDVKCRCTDPGLLLPRANLTFWRNGSLVRERNAMLPTISSKVLNSFAFYYFVLLI